MILRKRLVGVSVAGMPRVIWECFLFDCFTILCEDMHILHKIISIVMVKQKSIFTALTPFLLSDIVWWCTLNLIVSFVNIKSAFQQPLDGHKDLVSPLGTGHSRTLLAVPAFSIYSKNSSFPNSIPSMCGCGHGDSNALKIPGLHSQDHYGKWENKQKNKLPFSRTSASSRYTTSRRRHTDGGHASLRRPTTPVIASRPAKGWLYTYNLSFLKFIRTILEKKSLKDFLTKFTYKC